LVRLGCLATGTESTHSNKSGSQKENASRQWNGCDCEVDVSEIALCTVPSDCQNIRATMADDAADGPAAADGCVCSGDEL